VPRHEKERERMNKELGVWTDEAAAAAPQGAK
jgi:hypothetical protein